MLLGYDVIFVLGVVKVCFRRCMRKLVLCIIVLLLSGCSCEFIEKIYDVDYEFINCFVKNLVELFG